MPTCYLFKGLIRWKVCFSRRQPS